MSAAVAPSRSRFIDLSNCREELDKSTTRAPRIQPRSILKRGASMLPPKPDAPSSCKKKPRLSHAAESRVSSPAPSPPPAQDSTQAREDKSGDEDVMAHAVSLFGTSKGFMSRIFSATDLQLTTSAGEASPAMSDRFYLLLRAIVNFEVVCLSDDDENSPLESAQMDSTVSARPYAEKAGRRVAFCGWDGSAAKPPVDRVDGSAYHMANAVEALSTVVRIYAEGTSADAPWLRRIVRTLQEERDELVAKAAAGSVSHDDPTRIRRAINFLLEDVHATLLRLDLSWQGPFRRLNVDKKLAEWLAQSIRFHLRSLLDPALPRLSPNDVHYESRRVAFSQVSQHIEFVYEVPPKKISDAVTEYSISTLVSRALETIYAFHGDSILREGLPEILSDEMTGLWSRNLNPDLKAILDVPPSRLGVPAENLIESLKHYVNTSAQFLACRNAAQFLTDLFRLDLVSSEMSRRGGVSQMEKYATLMWTSQFHDHDDELTVSNAHLILLSNVASCIDQLDAWLQRTETHADDCLDTLMDVQTVARKWRRNSGLRDLIAEKLDYVVWMPRVKVITPSIRLKVIVQGRVREHTWN